MENQTPSLQPQTQQTTPPFFRRFHIIVTIGAFLALLLLISASLLIPKLERKTQTTSTPLPSTISDCQFFFDSCRGAETTVTTPLFIKQSLEKIPEVLPLLKNSNPEISTEEMFLEKAISANLNPLLVLTLLKQFQDVQIATPPDLDQVIVDLQKFAEAQSLSPQTINTAPDITSLSFFGKTYSVSPPLSRGSLVIAQMIAQHSNSVESFELILASFPAIYNNIAQAEVIASPKVLEDPEIYLAK